MIFTHEFCKRNKINAIYPLKKKRIMTLLVASILLNSEARDINDHVERGFLKEAEGEHHLERIEKELDSVQKAEYNEVKGGYDGLRLEEDI